MTERRSDPGTPIPPGSLPYAESLLESFHRDPESVAREWREYFSAAGEPGQNGAVRRQPAFRARNVFCGVTRPLAFDGESRLDPHALTLRDRLDQLVRNYRVRGHIIATVDPLGAQRPEPPELKLDYYGFTSAELELLASIPAFQPGTPLTVREFFQRLRDIYCRSIGVQFMHIDDLEIRQWLQRRIETPEEGHGLSRSDQLRIFTRLTDAVAFEDFLRKKFLGAKTFSLEGCETLLPLLDLALEHAGTQGVESVVIGMSHRGRLNVLAHIVGKDPRDIFAEFADADPELWQKRGDVKYHLGHSGDWTTADGRKIHLSLCFNPSHLEFVDPVVMGRVRALQDRIGDCERRKVLALIVHGDAAIAGEGVVQESLNLGRLAGYSIGGSLHVVVNNQIGFTTPPDEYRSTPYATDVARMLQVPIFHVNGEDPEAVARVIRLAMDFRAEFQMDVFIDMYGYRRWGHNESDEPSFTQPMMYKAIAQRPGVRESYLQRLLELKSVSPEEAAEISRDRHAQLERHLKEAADIKPATIAPLPGVWHDFLGGPEPSEDEATGVEAGRLAGLLRKLTELPQGFRVHRKLQRGLEQRREMAEGRRPLDWSAAEALALATLATEGVRIRLTGQDTARGTFSQRHAILFDQEDGRQHMPLQDFAPDQATVEIRNSPLCETGALGFEYGYSLDSPDALVLWEAQFGDFVNAAQVIIDQFISSAECKWRRLSGLVLLLPHGLEGMGPEHSSARLERFLALAAEDNIQFVQPTTPAQYFHVLRRQVRRRWRKPLVILTPKSLLRHPQCISTIEECARGSFQRVLLDPAPATPPNRVLICTGKIYYELATYRQEHRHSNVYIMRLEQLYPLRSDLFEKMFQGVPNGTPAIWVQEEPANMGAWPYLHERFGKHLFGRFPFAPIARDASASPASGSASVYRLEQARLLARAFGDREPAAAEALKDKSLKTDDKIVEGEPATPTPEETG